MSAFHNLKAHAKARGIPFEITFRYFMHFARLTKYVELKGIGGNCLTVDRKNNLLGYVRGNIQPLTRIQNSEKKARQDAMRMTAGFAWKKNYPPEVNKNGSRQPTSPTAEAAAKQSGNRSRQPA